MRFAFLLLLLPTPAMASSACEQFVRNHIASSARDLAYTMQAFDGLFREYSQVSPAITAIEEQYEARGFPKKLGCREAEDARLLHAGLSLKLKYLPEQNKKGEAILRALRTPAPKLKPQVSAAMVACLRNCALQNNVFLADLDPADACVKTCRVTEKNLDYVRKNDTLSLFFTSECLAPDSGELDLESTSELIRQGDADTGALIDSMERSWKSARRASTKLLPALKKRVASLAAILSRKTETSCLPSERVKQMEEATIQLSIEESGTGSGFYLGAPNGKIYLASARHVPALAGGYGDPLFPAAKPAGKILTFAMEPGKYDYENDAVLELAEAGMPALPLAGENEQPEFGQRFLAGGFPATAKGKFTTVECRFLGYGQNENGGTGYLLYCPVDMPINGMSGGPLVSEDGRVWGILVNQAEERGLVVASPVSAAPGGAPKFGISGTFLSDNCYTKLGLPQPPHRCQVFPGSLILPPELPND